MNDERSIQAAFAKARVPLKVTERSINQNLLGQGAREIVQLGIGRDRTGREVVELNLPEVEGVEVRALGADPEHQQVVLMVGEPKRRFLERVWNPTTNRVEEVQRRTGGKRRFLVGMDECHLFIAQLGDGAGATSVGQAHADLRPRGVPTGRAARKQKIKRTGEWFLIPATSEELKQVEERVRAHGVQEKVGIGAHLGPMRGRPHVVSESVVVGRRARAVGEGRRRQVVVEVPGVEFVRGRILHPDHKVVDLKGWHRVAMNTENRAVGAQWVD